LSAITFAAVWLCTTAGAQVTCPRPTTVDGVRTIVFDDGSFAMRLPMNVNADGAPGAYTQGDHGFTYITNGVDLWRDGRRIDCRDRRNNCRQRFLEAERRGFAPGTDEFCAFGIAVDAMLDTGPVPCRKGVVFGNGKGKPRLGGVLRSVAGEDVSYYVSTTSLTHPVGGQQSYLDAKLVPAVVIPMSRAESLGQVVWTRHGSQDAFAVAGDTGPNFGEASIALHQLLRYGMLVEQSPGPIPRSARCGPEEFGIKAPYMSRPDVSGDDCAGGREAQSDSDIRAYAGLASVDFVFLGGARFEREGNALTEEVTAASLTAHAEDAGYTKSRLQQMAACLEE